MRATLDILDPRSDAAADPIVPLAMRPLRVLIVAGSYPPDIRGGGEISTRILAESLAALDCTVDVLTCAQAERWDEGPDVQIHRIRSPNLYWNGGPAPGPGRKLTWHMLENWNPRARRVVGREIARVRPDIVITSTIENYGGEAWIAAREAGIPCVHVLRSYYSFCWRGSAFRRGCNCVGACWDCRFLSHGRRVASQTVNGVVGISRFILEQHLALGLFSRAQTVAISNPVGAERAAGPRTKGEATRLGYLGVISPNKGLELLREAWSRFAGTASTLTIAGTGDAGYEAGIRELFGESATFAGWVESRSFLDEIDFLVVPSIWNEPFGRIVVEAFAAGVPVIGSATGGIPEIIENGRNGYLFAGSDAADLAQVIARAVRIEPDEYRTMSEAALASAGGYESRVIAARYLAFLNAVIAAGRLRDAPQP